MTRAILSICLLAIAGSARSEPQVQGNPKEVAALLSGLPGTVTLTATAELKVEADRAKAVIKVANTAEQLQKALARNQQLREGVVTVLAGKGFAKERITLSRFSSSPTHGMFSRKVKGYDIESSVEVVAESEVELQAVGALIDATPELALADLRFESSRKDELLLQVQRMAFEKLDAQRALYEQRLNAQLRPRTVGNERGDAREPLLASKLSGGSGVGSYSGAFEGGIVLHALAQRAPSVDQFDQQVFEATLRVTYDLIPTPPGQR